MSKNRVYSLVLGLVAAALVTGVAIAAATPTKASVKAATATFSASTVSHAHNQTCTAKGGDAFQSTTATYKGTSTSQDPRLNGPITIKAHSFLDTTSGVGFIGGTFSIKGTGKAGAVGRVTGVISGGAVSGLLRGTTTGPEGSLLITLGSTFDQASGFGEGDLGSANTGGGVVYSNASCGTMKK
jgi:hypothetical protein